MLRLQDCWIHPERVRSASFISLNVQFAGVTADFHGKSMPLYCTSILAACSLVSTSNGAKSDTPVNFVRPLSYIHQRVSLNSMLSFALLPHPMRLNRVLSPVVVGVTVPVVVATIVPVVLFVVPVCINDVTGASSA